MLEKLFKHALRFLGLWITLLLIVVAFQVAVQTFFGVTRSFEEMFGLVLVFGALFFPAFRKLLWEIIAYLGVGIAIWGVFYALGLTQL